MKSFYSIMMFFILGLMLIPLRAQHKLSVTLNASMDQYFLDINTKGICKIIALEENHHYPGEKHLPALPLRRISILVPPGSELVDYSYRLEQELVEDQIILSEAPVAFPLNKKGTMTADPVANGAFYTDTALYFLSSQSQRGYSWFSFIYAPFAYEGQSGKLFLNKSTVLEIEYRINQSAIQPLRSDPGLTDRLKHKISNPMELDRMYPPGSREAPKWKSGQDQIEYLIVTSEKLKPGFVALKEWKSRKGLKAGIITIQEIDKAYDHATIQLKIKQCLYDHYLQNGLNWVLLGGDETEVPVQGCFGKVNLGEEDVVEPAMPTDLFYACFDKRFDWNSSGDEKVGQVFFDGHDLMPEVYLSRIPVRTLDHVEAFVSKTLNYEKYPPEDGFCGKVLLAGVELWRNWEGKSDAHHRSEFLFKEYIGKYWEGDKKMFYDTGTDFPGGSTYAVSSQNLVRQLNAGYGFFNFFGHGNVRSLLMEEGAVFNSDHVMSLSNPVSGLVLSSGCYVNAFDFSEHCLSEAFIRNPNGGAVAFFGSSRLGFGNPEKSETLGPSLQFNARFARYLFDSSRGPEWKSFARLSAMAKSDFVYNGSSGGAFHYLLYAINPMGDPELPLYTADPKVFNKVRIYRVGEKLLVNSGEAGNCRICITSLDLDEGYQELIEGVSYHTFENLPSAYQVTITAPGYKPHIFIQNPATSMLESRSLQLSLSPNPARDWIELKLESQGATAHLFDLKGRLLEEREVFPGSNRVDLSDYVEGIYLLYVESETGSSYFKLLKHN